MQINKKNKKLVAVRLGAVGLVSLGALFVSFSSNESFDSYQPEQSPVNYPSSVTPELQTPSQSSVPVPPSYVQEDKDAFNKQVIENLGNSGSLSQPEQSPVNYPSSVTPELQTPSQSSVPVPPSYVQEDKDAFNKQSIESLGNL